MIIKPKTHRYWPGIFHRLVHYIDSDKGRNDDRSFAIYHNLGSYDLGEIVQEFEANYRLKNRRTNSICLQHHIMSFAPESAPYLDEDILHDLAQQYLELRQEKGLCYARPHLHEKHWHIHFLISGNEKGQSKSTSRRTKELLNIQTQLEEYQLSRYPKLSDSIVKVKEHTQEQKLADLQERVLAKFTQARDSTDFVKRLESDGLKTYTYREKIQGFLDESGTKHRFGKFGVKVSELDKEKERRLMELDVLQKKKVLGQDRINLHQSP